MTEEKAKEILQNEGFSKIFTWTDASGALYPSHIHQNLTAHIVINGEITITMNGKSHFCKPGDRLDVPANTPHTATIGENGCTYVVGE